MSTFFLFNNLHFAIEILGALAFLAVTWLTLDAFLVRRTFSGAARGIGFGLLVVWQVIHAFGFTSDVVVYAGYAVYIAGIVFVLGNLLSEAVVSRPEFKAIVILPSLVAIGQLLNIAVAVGFFLIVFVAFLQYKREQKKVLFPFWLGFLFLGLGALAIGFIDPNGFTGLWIGAHILQLAGFLALGWWVWKYLELRVREELLLIFVSLTLVMATVVTLTFSSILVTRMENQTKGELLTNTKVLDFTLLRFHDVALAKGRLFAARPEVTKAIRENDFIQLEALTREFSEEERLGFLLVVNSDGIVMLRAHALTRKDDNVSSERAVASALRGEPYVTVETSPAEKFSIRAASPVIELVEGEEKVVGVIVAGFPLDNILADNMKRITGLDMSIFEHDTMVATTYFGPDGRTRGVGIKQTDPHIRRVVLEGGGSVVLRTEIFSRPYIASYLPIKNADGNIVGMLSAAKPQNEILQTAQATNRLTLIAVMVIMVILIMPVYLVTRRLGREVG